MNAPDKQANIDSTLSKLLSACAGAFSYPDQGIAATLEPLALACNDGWHIPPKIESDVKAVLDASHHFSDGTAEKLAYTRLFTGSLRMEAPPYASYYMTDDRTLNGRVAVEVGAVYNQFGLQLESREIAPADHLRYMLSFLSLLAARYEETGEEAFVDAFRDFRDAYIAPWFGQFQELVDKNAEEPYYPALVKLIGDVLDI